MRLFAAKVTIAVVAIGGLVLLAASEIAPSLAAWKVLLGAGVFALLLALAAVVHAFLAGSLNQLLLRWGAIDTQWLWAPDDPPGFKRQFRSAPHQGSE